MPEIAFNEWVFERLEEVGAVRNYEKNPHTGKGRSPKGNLSIQLAKITELRNSSDANQQIWGLIAYTGLQTGGEIGKKMTNVFMDFCRKVNPSDPDRLFRCMQMAVKHAHDEYHKRYKEKTCEVLEPSVN